MRIKPSTVSPRSRKKTNGKRASQHKLRVIENAKRILNNITVCNIFIPDERQKNPEWGNKTVFDGKTAIIVTQPLAWNLENIRVKWEITCGVFYRTQQGEHYIEYITIEAVKECNSIDIAEQAKKVCAYLFNNASKLEKLCPFYLAIPRSIEDHIVDLNLAYKAAHINKVFNRIGTTFEINCNMPFKDYHQDSWFNIPINWDKTKEIDIDLAKALNLSLVEIQTEYGTTIEPT